MSPTLVYSLQNQGGAGTELRATMASRSTSQQQLITTSSTHKFKPMPVTVSGVSVASTFWLVSTFLLIIGLVVAAGFPYWTTLDSPPTALKARDIKVGLFYLCFTPGAADSSADEVCSLYMFHELNETNLADIELKDIVFLFVGSISYGIGTGLLMISLIVGIVAYCKPRIKEQSVFLAGFVIQLFGCEYSV